MSEIKHISVVVVGNPDGNGGVGEIAMYNSPQFNVRHDIHPGLGDNSYYFSVKIENNYTVYKLIKNNVRSKGAFRGGYLAIAFSIPRGYALVTTTPYQVLIELWKAFKNACITLKDPQLDVYEFSSKMVDTAVLDELSASYSLKPVNRHFSPMNKQGGVALVQQPEDKIEELLSDVQYVEFSNFSEILIAESVGTTSNYTLLTNIQIPRPISYTIYIDRNAAGVVNDRNKKITVRSNANPHYFDNVEKSFTIAELLEGTEIPGITVDVDNEQVVVSTNGWATAKTKKIQVRIEPKAAEDYFKDNKDLIQVTKNNVLCILDDDFCFELTGQDIALFEGKNIDLKINKNNGYVLDKFTCGDDELKVLAKEYEQPNSEQSKPRMQKPAEKKCPVSSAANDASKCLDVKIVLSNAFFSEGKRTLDVQCLRTTPDGQQTIQQSLVLFRLNEQRHYEGHLYLSRIWSDSSVSFSFEHGVKRFVTNGKIDFNKSVLLLQQRDFMAVSAVKKIKYSRSNVIILLATFILGVGLGLAIGCGGSSHSEKSDEKEQSDDKRTENGVVMQGASAQGASAKEEFIKHADSLLNKKDVSFEQIHQLYNELKKMDIGANDPVSQKIMAYDRLVTFIESGNVKSAREADNLHLISVNHVSQVSKLNDNNWKDDQGKPITGFDKIKEEKNY